MTDTWFERASRIIRSIDATLPADATLKARRRALREGRPHEFKVTSWGQHSWGEAAKVYLSAHGAVPRQKPVDAGDLPLFGPSPLERARRKSRQRLSPSGLPMPRVG